MQTSAEEGETLDSGTFALRWPDIQSIRISSAQQITHGAFALSFPATSKFSHSDEATVQVLTPCLPWDVDSDVMADALNGMLSAGDVEVTRSQVEWSSGSFVGDMGYGYEYAVSFVSSHVAGNVPQLTHAATGSDGACEAFQTSGNGVVNRNDLITIKDMTAMPFGTDLEIQELKVSAAKQLVRGQYKLQFGLGSTLRTTACIEHDATADVLKASLQNLPNIDSVYVERSGDGSGASDFGYTYHLFFDGNLLINADPDGDGTSNPDLPLLEVVMGDPGCTDFETLSENILTTENVGAVVAVRGDCDICDDGGLDLAVSSASAAALKRELERLPACLVGVAHTSQSLLDDQGGQSWTMSFASVEGDIDEMYCSLSADTISNAPGAACRVQTLVDGNVLGGTFLLSGAGPLDFDASASNLKEAVESIAGVGTVVVTRSEADGERGYTWSVTFTSNPGDIAPLVPTSSLTGALAAIKIEEAQKGNALGGTYAVSFLGHPSAPMSVSASASEVRAILQAMDAVGYIDVTRSEIDSEGGSVYAVTFRDTSNPGDVPALVPNTDALTGQGATVVISEQRKGSEATAGSLWLSFESSKDVNGDPIRAYGIQWDTSPNLNANPRSFTVNPHTIAEDSIKFYREQRIVLGLSEQSVLRRRSQEAQAWQHEVQNVKVTGADADTFKLSFRGIETSDIVLGATTLEQLETALNSLYPAITLGGISVTGSALVGNGAAFAIEFLNEPGLLPLLVQSDGTVGLVSVERGISGDANFRKEIQSFQCSATGGSFTVGFAGSDDLVPVSFNADLHTFKAKLETLPTIGAGGITIATSDTDGLDARVCSGSVLFLVFDTYEGNVPSLEYADDDLVSASAQPISKDEIVRGISPQHLYVSGYCKLSLLGEETHILDVGASAERIRAAVEALPSVETASVTVGRSKEEIGQLTAVEGQQYLTCPTTPEDCGFEHGLFGFPGGKLLLKLFLIPSKENPKLIKMNLLKKNHTIII